MLKRTAVFLTSLALLSLLLLPVRHVSAGNGSTPAAELDASVLIKWMQLLYDRVQAEKISAPAASRLYAYAGVTAYQSVLPGIPEGISMAGQVTGLEDLPVPEEDGPYDWPSSANAALATVI